MSRIDRLPPTFQNRYHALLGDEFEAFLANIVQPPETFLRINTLKVPIATGLERLKAMGVEVTPLPWYKAGFRVQGNYEKLRYSIEYALGYYYLQEGASMIPPLALDLSPANLVLDVCAAPGSKTTQMAQMMANKGAIVANDRNFRRITSLGHNLQFCGVANTVVLCKDGRLLPTNLSIQFDRVLVDAPCTASGHFRSKPFSFKGFNQARVKGLQALQKGLLTAGFRLLKDNGLLVYSTCSLYPEENEDVVQHLLTRFENATLLKPHISHLNSHPGLTSWETRFYSNIMTRCRRIYPHDNDSDGFFIALIKKCHKDQS